MKVNLGCWIFYREGWINVDHDRSVRADRYEDAVTLPSFAPNSVEEIYAGHIAEHVDDLRAAFRRWREVLVPGGRITITVPDCRGANRLWHERKRFPALEVGPDEGILEIATGIKPADLHGRNPETLLHKRVFDESTLRICMEAAGFLQVRSVDDHEIMVAPCSSLGWQIALEGVKPGTHVRRHDSLRSGPGRLYLDLLRHTLCRDRLPDAGYEMLGGPAVLKPFDPTMRAEGRDWPTQAMTMVGEKRLRNLQECCVRALEDGIPGDFVETGVWRGGCAIMMRAVLAAAGDEMRRVWAFDSFEGMPKPDVTNYPADAPDRLWEYNDILGVDVETVRENFARFDLLDDRTEFVRGWFRETLGRAAVTEISVLRLDGDLYESTSLALTHLYPRVSAGGFILVDDYALPTCRAAVDDFRAELQSPAPLTCVDWSGVCWRK